jgi:hypothetical protein
VPRCRRAGASFPAGQVIWGLFIVGLVIGPAKKPSSLGLELRAITFMAVS